MEFRYKIPQGTMMIHTDVFFLDAGRSQIRKMLRDYKRSDPERAQINELRARLAEKIQKAEEEQKSLACRIQEKTSELKSCELRYEYQKTFCDNKEQREKAKEVLKACRAETRRLSSDLRRAKRCQETYKKSLDDVERILGSEEELE